MRAGGREFRPELDAEQAACTSKVASPDLMPRRPRQRRVQHLTQWLSLNASQQTQATTIFTTEQTANQPIMASLKTARTSLTAAIKSNSPTDIATISSQIGNLEGQMTQNAATANAAFYAILTPDQQAKYPVDGSFGGRGFGGRANRLDRAASTGCRL